MDKPNAEEQAVKPPSSMREAIDGTKAIMAAKPGDPFADLSVEKKPDTEVKAAEEPCEGCEEEKKAQLEAAKAKPKGRLFIVDEETGEKIPAVFSSEGKEYVPETMDTLKTWTGLGIHANKRLEEVKASEGIVKMILQAQKEGRLVIKDPVDGRPSPKETAPVTEEEDDEIITDPEVFKERQKRKAAEQRIGSLEKNVEMLTKMVTMKQINETEVEIRKEIDDCSKEFPLGKKREPEVWRLLAKVDDEGKPMYDTKSAMRIVHEAAIKDLREWVGEHPEFVEKDKIKKEGIQQYLREKEEKEKAPVASPSGLPAGKIGAPEEDEVKGIHGAVEKMKSYMASKKEAGKAF